MIHARFLVVVVVCTAFLGCGPTGNGGQGPVEHDDAGPSHDDAGPSHEDAGAFVDDDGGTVVEPLPVVDPACTENGCLRAVTPLGTFPKAVVEQYLADGVTIENGYSVARIRFFTDGREARALVTIPEPSTPPANGHHVVVHAPGTVGVGDVCAVGDGALGVGLSGYFGAYGFIGAALDYPGLGTEGAHPYLVASVAGRAALDAARATIAYARRHLVHVSRRVAIAGNSQGGHATIAALREHAAYAPDVDVRAFAAAAPASMQRAEWAAGVVVDGAHLIYHALVMYAWSAHYAHAGGPIFVDALASTIADVMESHCVVSTEGAPLFDGVLPTTASEIFDAAFLAAYTSNTFDGFPAIAQGFEENAFSAFPFTAPLLVYQGLVDDVVLPSMTDALVLELESAGEHVDYRLVEGAGHVDVAFGVVAFDQLRAAESRAWIRARLDE